MEETQNRDEPSENSPESEKSQSFESSLVDALPSLRAFACSLVKNRSLVDDLVQETALKAWDKQGSFRPGTNITAWLFTILRNTYLSSLRKSRREAEDPDNIHSSNLSMPAPQDFVIQAGEVTRAIQKLSKEQQDALILIGGQGHSYEEAAEIANCAVGTIKSRTSRARKSLGCFDD